MKSLKIKIQILFIGINWFILPKKLVALVENAPLILSLVLIKKPKKQLSVVTSEIHVKAERQKISHLVKKLRAFNNKNREKGKPAGFPLLSVLISSLSHLIYALLKKNRLPRCKATATYAIKMIIENFIKIILIVQSIFRYNHSKAASL